MRVRRSSEVVLKVVALTLAVCVSGVSVSAARFCMKQGISGAIHKEMKHMVESFPPGSQSPGLPHPGKIVARFLWNDSTEIWYANEFSEGFIFFCFDAQGNPVNRAGASYCIPAVEVETISIDENGVAVAPKDADFIENSVYGPGHRLLEHTSSAPHLKNQDAE